MNKRAVDQLYDEFETDDLPSPPFSPALVGPASAHHALPPVANSMHGPPPLRSTCLNLFDAMCHEKTTFLGVIPKDVVGLIRPFITHMSACSVCKSDKIELVCAEQVIGFAFGQTIKGNVCSLHNQCHNCNVVYGLNKAPGPLYVYTWTWINADNGRPLSKPEIAMICSACHSTCRYLPEYKIKQLSDLYPTI